MARSPFPAGPPGAEDPRAPTEHVDGEAGVVGEGRQPGDLGGRRRLEQGVGLEGHAVLDDVGGVGELVETDDLEAELVADVREDLAQLPDLVGVAGGENERGSPALSGRGVEGLLLAGGEVGAARGCEREQLVEHGAVEGLPSAVPWTSMYARRRSSRRSCPCPPSRPQRRSRTAPSVRPGPARGSAARSPGRPRGRRCDAGQRPPSPGLRAGAAGTFDRRPRPPGGQARGEAVRPDRSPFTTSAPASASGSSTPRCSTTSATRSTSNAITSTPST